MNNAIPLCPEEREYMVETRDVPKVILSGLKAAGAKAEPGKVWRGKYPTTLDLVIDIECPAGHPSYDQMSFAKVRLLVDPREGSLTVHRDETLGNLCPQCKQEAIDRWLVTCQGHEKNGHPDHEPGWIEVDDFPDDTPDEVIVRIMGGAQVSMRPDDSPMGHVFAAMETATRKFIARYDLTHPEYVEKQEREWCKGKREEFVQGKVAERMERAKTLLSSGTKMAGGTELVIKDVTPESVAEWLTEQGVSPSLGVNAAWEAVKGVPRCPTQALVRQAQALRRG